jgi:hypothetical protein
MPLQTTTRRQIRRSIGYTLGVMELRSTTGGGTSGGADLIDTGLSGADDEWNGWWFYVATDLDLKAADFTSSTGNVTFEVTAGATVNSGTEYEIWPPNFPPARVNSLIDQAVRQVTAAGGVVPNEATTLASTIGFYGHPHTNRIAAPDAMVYLKRIEVRDYVRSREILPTGTAWDETAGAIFTATKETEYVLDSGGSMKIVVSGAGNGQVISDSFASLDLSGYDRLEMSIMVETAVAASDLLIHLDDTASLASPIPAGGHIVPGIGAKVRYRLQIPIAEPQDVTAVISAGLEYNANSGANTIYVGSLIAVDSSSEQWRTVPDHYYRTDAEAREIQFSSDGMADTQFKALRLVGYDQPTMPSADTSNIDAAPDVVEAVAREYASNTTLSPEANRALRGIPTPQGARLE